MQDKVLIRRSDGRKQWVTREELDRLNEQRKHRDQMKAAKSDSFAQLTLAVVVGVVLLVALVIFVRLYLL